MRSLDPLLIDSFPVPPSHTPSSPNPPPSRPPSIPLPPLPSRVTSTVSLADDSIADIDVKDILHAIQDDDEEYEEDDCDDALKNSQDLNDILHAAPRFSIADPIDPHAFPNYPLFKSARSLTTPPPLPRSPPSPDIPTILATTPRPAALLRSTPSSPVSLSSSSVSNKRSHNVQPRLKRSDSNVSSELPYINVPPPRMQHYSDTPYGVYGVHDLDEDDDGVDDEQAVIDRKMKSVVDDDDDDDDIADDDDDDTRSWIDHDEFGRPVVVPLIRKEKRISTRHGGGGGVGGNHDAFDRLERQLEGEDSDASDSSLDLHTPLPHLMVRLGLLSPKSKLVVTQSQSLSQLADGRQSVASLASATSTTTKGGGLLKDARNTEHRRTRHRDGRLLRGGIGLTTGLGWSDSEDEDAPSALTRRISSLNLSRPSSLASNDGAGAKTRKNGVSSSLQGKRRTALSHSTSLYHVSTRGEQGDGNASGNALSRSQSSGMLGGDYASLGGKGKFGGGGGRDGVRDGGLDEWGMRRGGAADAATGDTRSRTPTRWSSHSLPVVASRTKIRTPARKDRSFGYGGGSARTSVASSTSNSSIGGMYDGAGAGGVILEEEDLVMGGAAAMVPRAMQRKGNVNNRGANVAHPMPTSHLTSSPSTASTSTTASSVSISLPVTPPLLDVEAGGVVEEESLIKGGSIAGVKREKSLPPLPPRGLRRSAGSSNLAGRASGSGPVVVAGAGGAESETRKRAVTTPSSSPPADLGNISVRGDGGRRSVGSNSSGGGAGYDVASGTGLSDSRRRTTTPRPLKLAQSPLLLSSSSTASPLPSPLLLPTKPSSADGVFLSAGVGGSFGFRSSSSRSRSPAPPPLTTPPLSLNTSGGLASSPLPSPNRMVMGMMMSGTSSLPSTPTTTTVNALLGGEKPKPRTGTGMAYRTSGSAPSTRMRLPSNVGRRPAVGASGSNNIVGAPVASDTGGRPIAL